MDQSIVRKQLGLLFLSTYEQWAGGLIYILNLIRALNLLEDSQKPSLIIFHGFESPLSDIRSINYPYIQFKQVNSPSIIGKIFLRCKRVITGKAAFYSALPETVYPYNKYVFLGKKPIYWIPDFQEWYLPHMFSEAEIKKRKTHQSEIADSGGKVVLSSQDALNDFKKFYPESKCELRLLRFASLLPDFSHLDIDAIREKYSLEGTYFMSPNQFWAHKNHILVLKAISSLKKYNLDFKVVFTGSPSDYRNSGFFKQLEEYVELHQIGPWVKFLGFIDRLDQLCLMKNARAIIQPSLFEGWSTVVEDAKAMNQFIMLSDLPVHKEQADANCIFFERNSEKGLAALIQQFTLSKPSITKIDYGKNIREFSETIIKVLQH